MFSDLLSGRELSWQLALRDIRAQYRQTALSLLLAFILPLAHTITWIFLSRTGMVNVTDTALPYNVYVFSGTIICAIFMDAVHAPLQQTIASEQMLAKINFPREFLVVSGIYQTLFNIGIYIFDLISCPSKNSFFERAADKKIFLIKSKTVGSFSDWRLQ